ncbi:MAG: hypothetical protein ACP5RH_08420 [Leptodesmis sp.]|uniref:hypothetical protein n=1 Tax=Leptodesmis sp. TaxID=3100501 RepID=UPI003D0EF04D
MAQSASSPNPIQPLSVGDVVTTGFRLYGAQAKPFLLISLIATLWVLVPFVVAFAIALFYVVTQDYYALLGLVIPAWVVLLLYCLGKYLANSALISRLSFKELINQPESLTDARRYTRSRVWSFLLVALGVTLIFLGITIAFYLAIAVLGFGVIAALGGFPGITTGNTNAALAIILVLLFILILIAAIVFFGWLSARLSAVELPLAVEPETTALQSISRFWELTKGNAWRVLLILFITFCITLPIQLLAQFLVNTAEVIVATVVPQESASAVAFQVLTLLLIYIMSFALGIALLPLWQTVKAAIYFDLRNQREGLGLELRDRRLKE